MTYPKLPALTYKVKISLLTSLISLLVGIAYLSLRTGFEDHSTYILKIWGLAFFIFFSPFLIQAFTRTDDGNEVLPMIVTLLMLALFNSFPVIFFPICIIGYCIFFYYAVLLIVGLWRGYRHWGNLLIYSAFSFMLAAWIITSCWAQATLSPTFIESMVAGVLGWKGWNGTDTLFHVTLSQMMKTYGVPTTGIDGLPAIFYHFGSHVLFGWYSSLTDIPVMQFYTIGYPLFIIPLLLNVILMYGTMLRDQCNHKKHNFFGLVMFLIFCFYFLQLLRHYYGGGGLGNSFLISESTAVSLILLIFNFNLVQRYWIQRHSYTKAHQYVLLFIAIPLSNILLGFAKISTFYVFEGILLYLFIRYAAYKKASHIVALLVNGCVALFTLYFTLENLPFGLRTFAKTTIDSTAIELFVFYNNGFHLLSFLLLFFYAILGISVVFFFYRIFSLKEFWKNFRDKNTLGAEIIVVSVIMGLLPTFFLNLYPPNYMYFLLIQSIISLCIIIAYVTEQTFSRFSNRWSLKTQIIGVLLLLVAFNFVSIPIKKDIKHNLLYINTNTRAELTSGEKAEYSDHKLHEYIGAFLKISRNSDNLRDTLKKNPYYKVIQQLMELDRLPREEKRRSRILVDLPSIVLPDVNRTVTVWLNPSINKKWMLYCYDLPLLVPALSGIAMIDGMPCNCPGLSGHGYIVYKDKTNCDKPELNAHVIAEAKKDGVTQVFLYNYNTNNFEKAQL